MSLTTVYNWIVLELVCPGPGPVDKKFALCGKYDTGEMLQRTLTSRMPRLGDIQVLRLSRLNISGWTLCAAKSEKASAHI